jgi:hypothetical protein
MLVVLCERYTMRCMFMIALKYLFSIDLEVLKVNSAPKNNLGSLEAGGTMVDCIVHLFLSFATILGIIKG